jgi:serine/threonine protein kinase
MKKYKIHIEDKKDLVLNIQTYFQANSNTIHKARNELKIIKFKDTNTIAKSFKIPNIIRSFIYTYLRDSKAKKSYQHSLKITDFTPVPIGYIEFYKFGLLDQSYFISEKFEYDFTIREPLLDNNFNNKNKILKLFAKFTFDLHQNNIFHNDYSPGNILIKKQNSTYIFKIVDINRMKFFKLSQEDRAKNFSKLWASDDELKIIGKEYIKLYHCDESFIDKMCFYSNQNKTIKNFKKRLKGK